MRTLHYLPPGSDTFACGFWNPVAPFWASVRYLTDQYRESDEIWCEKCMNAEVTQEHILTFELRKG